MSEPTKPTVAQARDALRLLLKHAWGDHEEPAFSIPARPETDADEILGYAIDRLEDLETWRVRAEGLLRWMVQNAPYRFSSYFAEDEMQIVDAQSLLGEGGQG